VARMESSLACRAVASRSLTKLRSLCIFHLILWLCANLAYLDSQS
jgi:hypothetical protein